MTEPSFWKKSTGGGTPLTGNYDYAWTIDGLLNTAYITAQTITGLKFNNGNGTFEVDENGSVTAKAINIKGGSVDIETTSETYDVIRLKNTEWTMEISPLQIKVTNDTIGGYILIQAGSVAGYWNNQLKFNLSSDYGSLSLYGLNGNPAFMFDANRTHVSICDANGDPTAQIDGATGSFYARNFYQTT